MNTKSKSGEVDQEISEIWLAKALHTAISFLPCECPLVNHVKTSYSKHHLTHKISIKTQKEKEEAKIKNADSIASKDSLNMLLNDDPKEIETLKPENHNENKSNSLKASSTKDQRIISDLEMNKISYQNSLKESKEKEKPSNKDINKNSKQTRAFLSKFLLPNESRIANEHKLKNSKPPTPSSAKRNTQMKISNSKRDSSQSTNRVSSKPKPKDLETSDRIINKIQSKDCLKYSYSNSQIDSNLWPASANKSSRPSSSKSSKRGNSSNQRGVTSLWKHRGSQKPYQSRFIPGKLKDLNSTTHKVKKASNQKLGESISGYSKYIAHKYKNLGSTNDSKLKPKGSERKTPTLIKPTTVKQASRNQYQQYDKNAKSFKQEPKNFGSKEYRYYSKLKSEKEKIIETDRKNNNSKSKDRKLFERLKYSLEECLKQKYGKRKYHQLFDDKSKTNTSRQKYLGKNEENKNSCFRNYISKDALEPKSNNWTEENIDFSKIPPIISPPRAFRPKTAVTKFNQNSQYTSNQQACASMRCLSDISQPSELDSFRNYKNEIEYMTPRDITPPCAESTRESILNQSKNSKLSSINWNALFYN